MIEAGIDFHGSYQWPLVRFSRRADELNYSIIANDKWAGRELDLTGAKYAFQSKDAKNAWFEIDDAIYYISVNNGEATLTISADTTKAVEKARAIARLAAPEFEETDEQKVEVTFWSNSAHGPASISRSLDVPLWDEISLNYTGSVRDELDVYLDANWRPSRGGQLMLWNGPPGTGKTTALRALAREWRDWCEMHYITDPDNFFGRNADYMMNVMVNGAGYVGDDKWRLLILEDCGELLGADAKQQMGQGLARLLNSVDGLIGQGLRFLILVTTNEELKKLHPAVIRPGRCLSQLEFDKLDPDEVLEWITAHKADKDMYGGSATIAELYAKKEHFRNQKNTKTMGFGV